ncbi:hypothetical protein [Streptomyces sp. SP2-10]|uniref:hypothetical protein n=1 Tax=Streptomyces sp. SP2-10 TaxID=2873385 RepID=UPI001CA75071|nr:hypothetical protein [Streptomyces sp. SP2-10]MBY8843489.1 hypothetical protein [Streptomyces sp. SP2-10]
MKLNCPIGDRRCQHGANTEPGSREAGDAAGEQNGAGLMAFEVKDGHGWLT